VHIGARAVEEVEVAPDSYHRISRERAPMEVAARFLIEAEWQKINKFNAQTRAELAAREARRVALNEEFCAGVRMCRFAGARRYLPNDSNAAPIEIRGKGGTTATHRRCMKVKMVTNYDEAVHRTPRPTEPSTMMTMLFFHIRV
jgi:hypothetical protein